jgi:hypothetical protein
VTVAPIPIVVLFVAVQPGKITVIFVPLSQVPSVSLVFAIVPAVIVVVVPIVYAYAIFRSRGAAGNEGGR